jgi:hypothetical protein
VGFATLWSSVFLGGAAAVLVPILLGMKRRGLLFLWPKLLLLPAYYAIISAAAWTSLYDFVKHPYYWCKTEHGLTRAQHRHKGPGRPFLPH